MARGDIDRHKASVIADGVACLDRQHAAAVESSVISRAPGQTTGQLRAATQRAVLAADPTAATRRREEAKKDARVEVWDERSGTAALAGRDLPPADVLAADKRIDNLARRLREAGHDGTLNQLRAKVYTTLLLGLPVETLTPEPPPPTETTPSQTTAGATTPAPGQDESRPSRSDVPVPAGTSTPPGPPVPGSANHPAGTPSRPQTSDGQDGRSNPADALPDPAATGARSRPQVSDSQVATPASPDRPANPAAAPSGPVGWLNLTLPLAAWLGASDWPGEVAGFGPVPVDDARALADLIAAQPGSRICLTLTDSRGRPIAHGCARSGHRAAGSADSPGRFSGKASTGAAGERNGWPLAQPARPRVQSR